VRLTRREKEVLLSLFRGYTQDEIAENASRSVNTVKTIIKHIYEKLGASNRADAIRIAISLGLLEDPPGEEAEAPAALPPALKPLLKR
jgi:DNA-binding CsgD family transcriptional regulator